MPTIEIAPDDWGDAKVADLQRLLENVASHFDQHLSPPAPHGHIIVSRSQEEHPRILYRSNSCGPHTIWLNVRDRLWSKYAYQFAHEYFHFLSRYEYLRDSKNQWFEEVMGEVASIFATRRMGQSWLTHAPYSNWAEYAPSLTAYSAELCTRPSHQLAEGRKLADFLAEHEDSFRADPYQRETNSIVAVNLIEIFDATPRFWELVRHIPNVAGTFDEFLSEWHHCAPHELKCGVESIQKALRQ